MTGRLRAFFRLLAVQAAWNYERMQGIGMVWASLPLLAPLATRDPARHREAVTRAGAFFNANPFLAGAAVGAAARGELDGVSGTDVARLRTALCGPLGALGDQLFWMGIVPGLSAAALVAVAVGAGWWTPLLVVVVFAGVRGVIGWWALDQGWRHGMAVGGAIRRSRLSRGVEWAGRSAALLAGTAIPLTTWWLLAPAAGARRWLAIALALVFFRLATRWRGRISTVELTVAVMLLTILWHWSTT